MASLDLLTHDFIPDDTNEYIATAVGAGLGYVSLHIYFRRYLGGLLGGVVPSGSWKIVGALLGGFLAFKGYQVARTYMNKTTA